MKSYREVLFDEWNKKKINLDKMCPKNIKLGRIYWVSIGKNIGAEVYGKSANFIRPVLVLKIFYLYGNTTFLGVPISSKVASKSGFMFYKFKDTKERPQVALLTQIRLFDTRRKVSEFDANIKNNDFLALKEKIKDLF